MIYNFNELSKSVAMVLKKEPGVIAAYFLGSVVYGKESRESDFDLAVVVENKKRISEENIYTLLQEITFPRDLDLSVVDKSSSPLFLFQLVSKGKRVYEKSEFEISIFEAFVLHNYYDTQHMRNIYFRNLGSKFHYAS